MADKQGAALPAWGEYTACDLRGQEREQR